MLLLKSKSQTSLLSVVSRKIHKDTAVLQQEQIPMLANAEINNAHLEEMILVNKLLSACQNRQTQEVLDILRELLEATKEHFALEELEMNDADFERFAPHKAEHARHLHELASLIKYYEKNLQPNAVIAYIEGNLKKWLVHHMETMDTAL